MSIGVKGVGQRLRPIGFLGKGAYFFLFFGLLAFLMVSGCQKQEEGPKKSRPWPVVKEYHQDLVTLNLALNKEQMTTVESVTVKLEVTLPEGYGVRLPQADDFGDFTVVSQSNEQRRLNADKQVELTKEYELEAFLPGAYSLPELTVSAWEKGKDGALVHELVSEPVVLQVVSLLSDAQAFEIGDIQGPVSPPQDMRVMLMAVGVGLVLLVLGFVLFRWWRRRKTRAAAMPSPLPFHQIAEEALARLEADGLIGKGEVKGFYSRLSAILRRYIEQQWGIKAPEMTSEEFLSALGAGQGPKGRAGQASLGHRDKAMLKGFLEQCDLVKFAKHHPQASEMETSLALCRDFIARSRPAESQSSQDRDRRER